MKKEQIIEKIRKVAALAQQGFDGEKDNAEKLVAQLLKKYNLTLEDIEEEKEKYHYLFDKRISELKAKRIYSQIFCRVTGKENGIGFLDGQSTEVKDVRRMLKAEGKKANIVMLASMADFITVKSMFDFYYPKYTELEEQFYHAFLIKNDLAIKNTDAKCTMSKEEIERILSFAKDIEKSQYHKRLSNANQE